MRMFMLLPTLWLAAAPGFAQEVGPEKPTQLINHHLAAAWKAQKLTPAGRTTDQEFLRRVSLDLIGRIPTVDEVQAFVKDAAADKRGKLIDRLLASEEHPRYWSRLWSSWLLPPKVDAKAREQLQKWLEQQLAKDGSHKELVANLLTAAGKSSENGAVHFILENRGTAVQRTRQQADGGFDMVPLTSRSLRLFLGYRLDANWLQEHDEEGFKGDWYQKHFWGTNVFFRQVETKEDGARPVRGVEVVDNPLFNEKGIVFYCKKNGVYLPSEAVFLDGRRLPRNDKRTRREVLAVFLTTHDNFAKGQVNRVWGQLFGRGLHERPVVDDFGSHHKVIHPELLDDLAKEFAAAGHDTRKLLRWICRSDAYQLQSSSNPTNDKPEAEVYFSRMPVHILNPDQLAESLLLALQVKDPKWRERVRAALANRSERFAAFDWDELAFPERVQDLMAMMNQKAVTDELFKGGSATVDKAVAAKTPAEGVEFICLTVLQRKPTARESAAIGKEVEKVKMSEDKDLASLYQDLFWALLNSNEFILNH